MVAKAKWGIGEAGFDSVEAFNEPVSLWWNVRKEEEGEAEEEEEEEEEEDIHMTPS
jgi:hypothetical protein